MQREYADGTEPDVLPHWRSAECNGPCQQGRAPCPCPQACERVSADDLGVFETLGRMVILALAFVGLSAVVVYFGGCTA